MDHRTQSRAIAAQLSVYISVLLSDKKVHPKILLWNAAGSLRTNWRFWSSNVQYYFFLIQEFPDLKTLNWSSFQFWIFQQFKNLWKENRNGKTPSDDSLICHAWKLWKSENFQTWDFRPPKITDCIQLHRKLILQEPYFLGRPTSNRLM